MDVTEQMTLDTESALSHWWCGTDWNDLGEDLALVEDDKSYTDDAVFGARLFEEYEVETLELLTKWRGYLGASDTDMARPSVRDFILATYLVWEEELGETPQREAGW